MDIKYPDVKVQLTGCDSHPFAIVKAVRDGLKAAGVPQAELEAFREEALSGNYDHVLQTAMKWVDVS
jgi:hypothetical protein